METVTLYLRGGHVLPVDFSSTFENGMFDLADEDYTPGDAIKAVKKAIKAGDSLLAPDGSLVHPLFGSVMAYRYDRG